MDRRHFLHALLAGAGAALVPGFARAGDPAQFAAGLARDPWLAGWKSVQRESVPSATAQLRGRLPRGLAGTLYRNGPARYERNGFRYEHWFDGDGLVHGWQLADGRVRHHARMVATTKFTREQAAGRFLYPSAGTRIPDAQPVRNNDDANTANTAVMMLDGRLFALWEGGSAYELHPDTLQTIGPVAWRPDLAALPFSAHPLRDRDGSLWNFGAVGLLGGSGLLLYHLSPGGKLLSVHNLKTPALGYLHAFAMTESSLVFVLAPFAMAEEGAFFERLRFQPDQPARIAVVPKADPEAVRWFETDYMMAYHFADAFERDGQIVVRTVRHADPESARSPMHAAMNGNGHGQHGNTQLAQLRIDLRAGRASLEDAAVGNLEFPAFDPRTAGNRPARLYAPTVVGEAPTFNAIMAIDTERGHNRVHAYGEHVFAEEHIFVPRPDSNRPDDGWLLGTLLDWKRQRSGLAVLDARHVEDGPVCEAWLDEAFPLGFHGAFAAT